MTECGRWIFSGKEQRNGLLNTQLSNTPLGKGGVRIGRGRMHPVLAFLFLKVFYYADGQSQISESGMINIDDLESPKCQEKFRVANGESRFIHLPNSVVSSDLPASCRVNRSGI
jgi:hypothetical protein